MKEKLAEQGCIAIGGTTQQYADHIKREVARRAGVVKKSGAKVDQLCPAQSHHRGRGPRFLEVDQQSRRPSMHHGSVDMALACMVAAKAKVCRISQSTLQRVSRALLFVLLFNVAAFASQACVAPVASTAIVDLSVLPCESEAEGCLAETFANDGALQSRRVVAVPSACPTEPLLIATAAEQPRSSHWDAWPLPEPLAPLFLQICRFLI